MNTFELIILIIAGLFLTWMGFLIHKKFVQDEIQKGTEEKLKGNDYKFKWTKFPNPKTAIWTYHEIKNGIDKNVEKINKSNNIQEPKQ